MDIIKILEDLRRDLLEHSKDTCWIGPGETLLDRLDCLLETLLPKGKEPIQEVLPLFPREKNSGNPILCYVKGPVAFFTTQDLSDQTGDDWNDAPYQYNAEEPTDDWEAFKEGRAPKWQIIEVLFDNRKLEERGLVPYCSVDDMNSRLYPWLTKFNGSGYDEIKSGMTLGDFTSYLDTKGVAYRLL
jgi:hypothetical protein